MGILAQTAPDLGGVLPTDGITAVEWITAGIVLAVTILLTRVGRALVMRTFRRVGSAGPLAHAVARLMEYIVVLIGLFYALTVLGVQVGPLLGAIGLGGLVLALAVQGTLENVVAGFMLQARREFHVDDLIVTSDHTGIVEDINARAVVMRTLNGTRVIIPNSAVLNGPLEILTAGTVRRSSLVVGVEYSTDLVRARTVLEQAARGADGVAASPQADVGVIQFGDSSIDFSVRFWHGTMDHDRFVATSNVATRIKAEFDRAGITIAFPQRVLWTGEPLRIADRGA